MILLGVQQTVASVRRAAERTGVLGELIHNDKRAVTPEHLARRSAK
jgi:hypothetical protein